MVGADSDRDAVHTLIREGAGKDRWRSFMARLDAYRDFLERHGYVHLLQDRERLDLAAAGHEIQRLEGHGDWVLSVAFSPDGETLASGSAEIRLGRRSEASPASSATPSCFG